MLEEKQQQQLLRASIESLGMYMYCKFVLLIYYNDINYWEIFVAQVEGADGVMC